MSEHPLTRPVGSDADMFIQWKNTNVCLDFHCPCGAHCHFDGDFAYELRCPHCLSVFEMGTQVIAKRVEGTRANDMEPDDDMPVIPPGKDSA